MFLGRQLVERTTYVRDDAGNVIESITVRDPEYTATDRAWLMALLAEENERCGGCGQQLSVCMDPATQQTWTVKRVTCEACRVMEAEQDNDAEYATNGGRARGRKYLVERT